MGAAQGDDLAVIETHSAEDGPEMGLLFCAVGETAIRRAHGDVSVCPTGSPGHSGTLHFLNGADAGERPEVGVRYPREFFCKRH